MSTHTLSMIQIIADYFKTQPVLKAWIFGSFARGEEKPWSDMDILVQYDRTQPIGLLKIAGMQLDLEDLLGLEVDLVEEGTLRPWAVESVNNDKQLIYESYNFCLFFIHYQFSILSPIISKKIRKCY